MSLVGCLVVSFATLVMWFIADAQKCTHLLYYSSAMISFIPLLIAAAVAMFGAPVPLKSLFAPKRTFYFFGLKNVGICHDVAHPWFEDISILKPQRAYEVPGGVNCKHVGVFMSLRAGAM